MRFFSLGFSLSCGVPPFLSLGDLYFHSCRRADQVCSPMLTQPSLGPVADVPPLGSPGQLAWASTCCSILLYKYE